MKIRLIITDRSWEYRLHAAPQEPGKYYTTLRAADGGRLSPTAVTGPFPTLDAIQENAEQIYLHLVAMLETNKASACGGSFRETTIHHSAEHTARG